VGNIFILLQTPLMREQQNDLASGFPSEFRHFYEGLERCTSFFMVVYAIRKGDGKWEEGVLTAFQYRFFMTPTSKCRCNVSTNALCV
jgi:hypothetical protein